MEEFLDVIDETDAVLRQETRTAVHAQGWWHRGVHVFLFTPGGKLLIQKRGADRKQYASLWDGSVSEHVKAGEGYVEAAQRGLKEELGVEGIVLEPLVKFRLNYGPNDNEISMVFKGVAEAAPIPFDAVEIAEVTYTDLDTLRVRMEQEPGAFCGWFIEILNWYSGKPFAFTALPRQ